MKKEIVGPFIGSMLGVVLIIFLSGNNNYFSGILAGLFGALFGLGIVALARKWFPKLEQNNDPERNERIHLMIRKFLSRMAIAIIGVIGLVTIVIYYLGYQSIHINYVILFLSIVLFTVFAGVTIIRIRS
ncbi:hypothetical protein WAK64_21350 [Bacillus spongiae]|uniref:DUF2178 domain-containing protein n=1 Tax=Bacillus spongiae TaxID=2683610 RepID=A0ABU8HJI8_9BACI